MPGFAFFAAFAASREDDVSREDAKARRRRAGTRLVAFALLLASCRSVAPDADEMLAGAAEYLWSQQASDGGWHSDTHGIARGGAAWTAFVLHSLLQVPEDRARRPEGGVDRALDFLASRVDSAGALGRDGPVLDYPNYATAYALRVFAEHGRPSDSVLVRRMSTYLAGQQLTESRGFTPDHPAYGAWGFGEAGVTPERPGHVDLSHTRRVLGALRAAGALTSEAASAATRFLRLLQKHPSETRPQPPGDRRGAYDGGFYASSVTLGVNKAGLDGDGTFRPYATATADGLIALIEAGHAVDSEPVQSALRWLREHAEWDAPAGIPTDNPARWDRVMRLYHIASRAETYVLTGQAGWEDDAADALAGFRREDGSFANPQGAANKEDDPLIGTALAVEALAQFITLTRP